MVKLTGGQRIDLLGIRKEDLPGVWADLGMPSGYAYGKSFRTVKTCVGSGVLPVRGGRLDERWASRSNPGSRAWNRRRRSRWRSPAARGTAPSRSCKDVGVVAIDGGRWEIYIGGAAGAHIRKGDLLATVDDPDLVVTLSGRFMQYYRENAKWLERTYAFVPTDGHRLPARGHRRGQPGHRRRAGRADAEVRRRLPGPLAGGRGTGHPRPVPHLPAAGGPAERRFVQHGADPMTAVMGSDAADVAVHRLGPLDQIPVGRGPRVRCRR